MSKPLTDQQIELLVTHMCERDRQVEPYVISVLLALQVLLSEIRTAMDAEDHERAYWITLIAHTKAFAIFPGEMDERAGQSERAYLVMRRSNDANRFRLERNRKSGDESGYGIKNLVPASRFELLTPRV
jgi:hypothetical protein